MPRLAHKYSYRHRFIRAVCAGLLFVSLAVNCSGQTASVSLLSAASIAGGTVTLPLSMTATGGQPAAMQWTMTYPASDVASLTVTAGPSATAAGKAVQCRTSAGSTICVLSGVNTNTMANGTVATVAVQLAPAVAGASVPLTVTGPVSASTAGTAVPTTATSGAIAITAPPPAPSASLASLVCNPSSLAAPGSASCTVTLSQAASSSGAAVSLSSGAQLAVPASVTVAPGATSAAFSATAAAAVLTNTNVAVSASFGGVAKTATVTLTASTAPTLSGITCLQTTIVAGASTACTATLTKAAPAIMDVALSSSSAAVSVPATARFAAGATSVQFTATATASAAGTFTITGTIVDVTRTTQLTVTAGGLGISKVECPATPLVPGSRMNCTVTLTGAAPAAGATLTLTSNSASVTVPATALVAGGKNTAQMTASAAATATPATVQLTAKLGSSQVSVNVTVERLVPSVLSCSPNPLKAGSLLICKVVMNGPALTTISLNNASSAPVVIGVPAVTTIIAGRTEGRFVAYSQSGAPAQKVRVSTTYAGTTINNDITIAAKSSSAITQSSVSAPEVSSEAVQAGAVEADAVENPTVESIVNGATLASSGACSPGGAAILKGGRLFSGDPASVRVEVNGEFVPVMIASESEVTFECPNLPAGTPLMVILHTDNQVSNAIQIEMEEAGPGIFTIDGVERGLGTILHDDSGELAVKAEGVEGRASRPGDTITIVATGLGQTFGEGGEVSAAPIVTVGGMSASVLSVTKVEKGVYEVNVRVPETAQEGEAVAVEIQMPAMSGRVLKGNQAHISIERPAY